MLQKKTQNKNGLFFLPMGGCGEIGRNLNFFGIKNQDQEEWIIVDAGISIQRKLGVQVIYSALGQMKHKNIKAIVCTHAHDDHIGAIPFIIQELKFQVPIYATEFTMLLLKEKLKEKKILEKCNLVIVKTHETFNIGKFKIEFIYVTHSIPEPNMIKIETEFGNIIHTGDWKFDNEPIVGNVTNYDYLKNIGKNMSVDYLICDSTNALEKVRTKSEGEAAKNLEKYILENHYRKRIVVSCISSNVARIQTLLKIAHKAKRKVSFLGFSLERITNIAKQLNYLNDFDILTEKESIRNSKEKMLIICTGSQGEPNSGLDKISSGIHRYLQVTKGDLVIFSARVIPGNEVEVNHIKNQLCKSGVDILDTHMDSSIHVSGHPSQIEIIEMIKYFNPKNVLPVHGDAIRFKAYENFLKAENIPINLINKNYNSIVQKHDPKAMNLCILENGDMIELDRKLPRFAGHVKPGIMAVDGLYPISIDNEIFEQRDKMSKDGIVIITIFNKKVTFHTIGLNTISDRSFKAFLAKNRNNHHEIERHVQFFFYEYYGKLPIIHVNRIENKI